MMGPGVLDGAEEVAARSPSRRAVIPPFLVRLSLLLSVGIGLFSAAGLCGRAHWMLELFSHFRLHYTLALAGLVFVPLLARQWKVFAFVGLLFSIHAASLMPLWIKRPPPGVAGRELRVVLWNVNTANRRHDEVLHFLRQTDADIILVLEVDDRWRRELEDGLPAYPYVVARPRDDNFGIALFSKLFFRGGPEPMGRASLPIVRAKFQSPDPEFELIGVHAMPPKNGEYAALRNDMFEQLIDVVPNLDGPVVLLGDLNVTPWSPYFGELLVDTGLTDGRRGFGLKPTWPAPLGPLGIPIDHCFVSPGVTVRSFEVGPGAGSDHRAVVVDLTIPSRTQAEEKRP